MLHARRAIFAIAAWVGLVVSQNNVHGQPSMTIPGDQGAAKQGRVTSKTVFSSKLRLVFFMGLEGTGHHYMSQVFQELYKQHDDLPLFEACQAGRSMYLPWAMSRSAAEYQEAREILRNDMQTLAVAANRDDMPAGGTIVTVQRTNPAQLQNCSEMGEISYPNAHGPEKSLQYPDLQMLAEVAEDEGVDLRIIYLQRSAKALMISNIIHRHLEGHFMGLKVHDDRSKEAKFLHYIRIMLTDAAVLHSQLEELGPDFVVCFDYANMWSADQTSKVADFVSPSNAIAKYVKTSLSENARPPTGKEEENFSFKGTDIVLERLQRKLDVLESVFC